MSDWLPSSAVVRVGEDVWLRAGGSVLVGGAPVRALRLGGGVRVGADRTLDLTTPSSRALAARLVSLGVAHPDPATLPPVPLEAVTVVIPTHGRAGRLDTLLRGLRGVAILVVDDGSDAGDADAVRAAAERHGARLVRLDENVGPASARNAGLREVTTPFVAFADSDVEADLDALSLLLRHFADPALALVGPHIAGVGDADGWIGRYENARSSVDLGRRPALVRPRSTVSWMSSTFLVARRDALGTGFTEGRRVAEDVDLVWRMDAAGLRVRYEPRASVGHHHRARFGAWFARKLFYGTGAALLAQDHPSAIPPAILRPWTTGVLVALAAGRRLGLLAAVAIAVVSAARLRRRLPGRSWILALQLVAGGVQSALTQASALLLRHWWPLAVAASLFSRRARRIVVGFALVDAGVEWLRLRPRLDPLRFLVARRLDDIAYGTGLWLGSIRARRVRALLPELIPRRAEPTSPAPAPATAPLTAATHSPAPEPGGADATVSAD